MPVLPEVASSRARPGPSAPRRSASSTMARAARSLTEPPAFTYSSLAWISTPGLGSKPLRRTSGVPPIRGATGTIVSVVSLVIPKNKRPGRSSRAFETSVSFGFFRLQLIPTSRTSRAAGLFEAPTTTDADGRWSHEGSITGLTRSLPMFLGHFGLGFATKRVTPEVSLGTLFLACQLADLLWPTLVLLGVEHVEIEPGATAMTPLNFVSYPYSHSLLALCVWGVAFGAVSTIVRHSRLVSAVALAFLVISHWVLDA